jgi:hypothetical protein
MYVFVLTSQKATGMVFQSGSIFWEYLTRVVEYSSSSFTGGKTSSAAAAAAASISLASKTLDRRHKCVRDFE